MCIRDRDTEVVNFYDEDKNLVNRVRSSKGKQKHTITVLHDAKENTYKLGVRLADKAQVIRKKPHPIIQKHWDERHQQLTDFIATQIQNMADNSPVELETLTNNLFVEADFATIVKKNFEEVANSLQQLKLTLEQLQFSYTHV